MMSRIHQEASLSDDVYYQLKDYILSDVIHPAERLQIAVLSQHFGVSITPIREALIRLSAEGLIELRPGRGFFYKEFIPAEQLQLYDAMFGLLKYAIEKGGTRHVRFLYELKARSSESVGQRNEADIRADVQAAETLLEQIALISGNPQISAQMRSYCERTRISRILDLEQPANAVQIFADLKLLVGVLQGGESEKAIAMLRDQFEKKRARMSALASERRRRLYESYPFLRPGAGRHLAVRYRAEDQDEVPSE